MIVKPRWPQSIIVNLHRDKPAIDDPGYVYIGRPSKWGNPFTDRPNSLARWRVKSRAIAVSSYERWIRDQPELLAALPELEGKILGCWCDPLPCHGHVLLKLTREFRMKGLFK